MNISIISTYKEKGSVKGSSGKISKVLLELAERHLECKETGHLISLNGIEKVKRKLQNR